MTSFTPIIPKLPDWSGNMAQALTDAVNTGVSWIANDFDASVSTWSTPPDFTNNLAHQEGSDLVGSSSTDNEIYGYVNFGTKPHDILPRNAKRLHFLSGYTPKTAKRIVQAQDGGPSGSDVFSAGVHHPGSEAREFDQAIVEKRQDDFEAMCVRLLTAAAGRP